MDRSARHEAAAITKETEKEEQKQCYRERKELQISEEKKIIELERKSMKKKVRERKKNRRR
jgi:hypothetical protein